MENLIEIVSVPVITGIVFGAAELYKKVVGDKESLIRLIPLIGALIGVILGIVAFYAAPDIVAADNIFTAMLTGGASGLAATGTNQIFKQLQKFGINTDTKKDGEDKNDDEPSD